MSYQERPDLELPDDTVRIVMWGKDYTVILYDRLFQSPPTIEQLKDIRNASKVVFEDRTD